MRTQDLPCAPPTDNSCKQDLLRIISDIRTKRVYCPAVVTVRALHDVGLRHKWFEGSKNNFERFMHELAAEQTEQRTRRILSCAWNAVRTILTSDSGTNTLWDSQKSNRHKRIAMGAPGGVLDVPWRKVQWMKLALASGI